MKIQFKLLDSSNDIQKKILDALLPEINTLINQSVNSIKKELPNIVFGAISRSPEYQSLISGNLQYEFGVSDPVNKISGLIDIWSKNIQYSYTKPYVANNKIFAKFSASMIKIDFSDVLYSDYAYVQDYSRGYSLPWLEWLLLYGNTTIIKNYEVVFGANSRSRTGFAIMRNSSGSWKVPSEFAGTISDNWITRSIESARPDIDSLLQRVLS